MRNVIIPLIAAGLFISTIGAIEIYRAGYMSGLRNCPAPARTTIISPKAHTEEIMCVRRIRKST